MSPYSCQNLKQLLEQGKALKVGSYAFSSGVARKSTHSSHEEQKLGLPGALPKSVLKRISWTFFTVLNYLPVPLRELNLWLSRSS